MATRPEDVQATFCATLVDEWVRAGVELAVVAPGSRSTPLALALALDPRVRVEVHHDERSGGFLALGAALVTGRPAVVVTTSGTAAAELHPAVIEADLAGVPMLVCTADRPPELIDVGAPQAIDQTHLFGRSVRWFHAPGVPVDASRGRWRALASRAVVEATGSAPGPVHLNLAFREPLLGVAGELPPGRPGQIPWTVRPASPPSGDPPVPVASTLAGRRGILVAGYGSGDGAQVAALASALGWPILAAPQARVWANADPVIRGADAILRVEDWARALRPEVAVQLGSPLASRVVNEWLADSEASLIVAGPPGAWIDPQGTAAISLAVDPGALVEAWLDEVDDITAVPEPHWLDHWRTAGATAMAAVDEALAGHPGATEPGTVQAVLDALPAGAKLVVSSSMPVRDLEWYGRPTHPVQVCANRGANGIDGVVSTGVGAALASSAPTALVIGDVAFLHDTNGLLGAAGRGVDLVIIVIDNDGGGIFSFLPQAQHVDPRTFELLYGTPHGLDLVELATAFGAVASVPDDVEGAVRDAIAAGGLRVLVVRTQRDSNRAVHADLNAAVARALGPPPP